MSGRVEGLSEAPVELYRLNINTFEALDTLQTGKDGSFAYEVPVKEGDPEFIYLFYNGHKLASLLLKQGDKVQLLADTLGKCQIEGSEDSQLLCESEKHFADFASKMVQLNVAEDNAGMSKLFVDYYREDVKFVLSHAKSLVSVPVLYESLNEYSPVFGQLNDALIFRSVCDSLKEVYPDSRYVKALEKETQRREQNLSLQHSISSAQEADFPDLNLPDIYGNKVSLAGLGARMVLLHFWNPADPEQKMFNLDVLKPLYDSYHAAGLEIYAVGVDTDKAEWAATVKAQNMPWINVNDGLGAASTALQLYNVRSLPTTLLLGHGEVVGVTNEAGLRSELAKRLK